MFLRMSLTDIVRSVNRWKKDHSLGLTYHGQKHDAAVWSTGNCLITACKVAENITEVRLRPYERVLPDSGANNSWCILQDLFKRVGWINASEHDVYYDYRVELSSPAGLEQLAQSAKGLPIIIGGDVEAAGPGSVGIRADGDALVINTRARGGDHDVSIESGTTLYAQQFDYETRTGAGTLKPLLQEQSANHRAELAELTKLELQLRAMVAMGIIQPAVKTQKEKAKEAAEEFFAKLAAQLATDAVDGRGNLPQEPEQHLVTNQSGGVEINAQTLNIYGDVTGRDKTGAGGGDVPSMPQELRPSDP